MNTTRTNDFRTFTRQVRLRGRLVPQTALRVGAGREYSLLGDDLPVVKDTRQRPVIPGSSLKGAVRAYAEQILRSLAPLTDRNENAPRLSCDPLTDLCLSNEDVAEIKEGPNADMELRRHSCWACRLFGAPWMASRVLFKDLAVEEGAWFDQFGHRDGVSIDRDKGAAGDKRRYTFEVVPENTPFVFEMVVDGATEAELGLLLLALEGLNYGLVLLGGARSRGLGDVHLMVNWEEVEDITAENALALLGARVRDQSVPRVSWKQTQRETWIEKFFQEIQLRQDAIDHWKEARRRREADDEA
jgi:CRISPR-associated RAMP protein (TIGR02581 family)